MPRQTLQFLLKLGLCAGLALPAVAAAPRVTQVPDGIWKGTLTRKDGPARSALAFVQGGDKEGEVRLILSDGDLAGLKLAPGGEGTGTEYRNHGGNLQLRWQLASARPGKVFQGVYQAVDANGVTLGRFVFDDYLRVYNLPTDQAAMAGTYYSKPAQNSLSQELELTLKADGNFVATGPAQLSLGGALAVPDSSHSVFLASYRLSVPNHPPQDGTALGYVFKDGKTDVRTILMTGDLGGRGLLATFQTR
jgi:hypothetical protein